MSAAVGSIYDVSSLLRFIFYQPVHRMNDESALASDSREVHFRFVGVSEKVCHEMAFQCSFSVQAQS